MEIKILQRQGVSIRRIARQMGVSRNTVRKYLRSQGEPGYASRPARPGKLDPFKRYIEARNIAFKAGSDLRNQLITKFTV